MHETVASTFEIRIDGNRYLAREGDTVMQIARENDIEIPALCFDPRLEPCGACRTCLIEVEGERRLQPACTWKVQPNMQVLTDSDRIRRHRRVLFGMYLADHQMETNGPSDSASGNELLELCRKFEPLELEEVSSPRGGREHDENPYIGFDPSLCILCARCTRYCDEIEGVNAITLTNRGGETTISTAGNRGLLDTSCELCGGCIDTCPTGAFFEKKVAEIGSQETTTTRTTCNFCGVGCQIDLHVAENRVVNITSPPPGETVNDGNLCVKGRFAYDFIHHEDRLTRPLVRRNGQLVPTSWDEAITTAAQGLLGVKSRHGADSLGFISSSRCTSEENYLMQKLARAAFETNNIHQCAAT